MSSKNRQDYYSIKAKKEKFPSRAVYKLQEMHVKYNLIKKNDKVLDLGCFPGSWLIYAAKLTGNNGYVIGIDLKSVCVKLPSNVKVHTKNVLDIVESINEKFNVVLSDMAPSTTGNKGVDSARSFELCIAALSIAQKVLTVGGCFVCKIFQGEDFKKFSDLVKSNFNKHKIFKPKSSRKTSKEIYVIGFGKK